MRILRMMGQLWIYIKVIATVSNQNKGASSLTLPSEYLTVLTHYKTLKIYY